MIEWIKTQANLIILVLVTAVVCFGLGYASGVMHEQAKEASRQLKVTNTALVQVAKVEHAQAAAVASVDTTLTNKREAVQIVTRTIIQKVPEYVTVQADAKSYIPVGFVRLHDASASGINPTDTKATGSDNDSPSSFALSDVAETVALNYGLYHDVAARLEACQAYVVAIQPDDHK